MNTLSCTQHETEPIPCIVKEIIREKEYVLEYFWNEPIDRNFTEMDEKEFLSYAVDFNRKWIFMNIGLGFKNDVQNYIKLHHLEKKLFETNNKSRNILSLGEKYVNIFTDKILAIDTWDENKLYHAIIYVQK